MTLCQRICICIKRTCRSADNPCAMEKQDLCIKRFDEQQPPHQLSPPCKFLLMLPQLLPHLAASKLVPFRVYIHFLPTSSYPHTADPREVAFQCFGICPRAVSVVIIIILSQLLRQESNTLHVAQTEKLHADMRKMFYSQPLHAIWAHKHTLLGNISLLR